LKKSIQCGPSLPVAATCRWNAVTSPLSPFQSTVKQACFPGSLRLSCAVPCPFVSPPSGTSLGVSWTVNRPLGSWYLGPISCAAAEVGPANTKVDETKAIHSPARPSPRVSPPRCSIIGPFLSAPTIPVPDLQSRRYQIIQPDRTTI